MKRLSVEGIKSLPDVPTKEIKIEQICELGNILSGKSMGRKNSEQITIADLTGVAVQDVQIATAVFKSYLEKIK